MDASGKPQASRELIERLSNPTIAAGSASAYGMTRYQSVNRKCDNERRFIKRYRDSTVVNSSLGPRRVGSEMGAVRRRTVQADQAEGSVSLVGQNRRLNSVSLRPNSTEANNRQAFNSGNTQPTFREPPARGYDPFS